MKKTGLAFRVAALGLSSCLLVSAGLAWACVPYPMIVVGPQSSGPPGTDVKVSGVSFAPGQIEVRWNSLEGPMLSTASDPDFSVDAKIPPAEEGLYAVVALTRDPDGGVSSLARASFLVTGPGGALPQAEAPARSPRPAEAARPPMSAVGLLLAGGGLVGIGLFLGFYILRRRGSSPGV